MADSIKDSLLKAMRTVVEDSVNHIVADVTITATIKKLDNAALNKYTVKYGSGEMAAYCEDGASYNPNDSVYVLVPSGDYKNKKIILGKAKVNTEEDLSDDITAVVERYNILGTSIINLGNYKFGLHSNYVNDDMLIWADEEWARKYYSDEQELKDFLDSQIYKGNNPIDIESLDNSREIAKGLMLKMNIKTELEQAMTKSLTGYYGLTIGVSYEDPTDSSNVIDDQLSFLSSVDILGNPLRLFNGSNQKKTFIPFDFKRFKKINYITAFSGGFVETSPTEEVPADIFIENIELNMLAEITAVNGDYSLTLSMPKGNTIKLYGSESNEEPTPQTKYNIVCSTNYKETSISDKCTYYWAAEDLTVDRYDKERFNVYTGVGWRVLSKSNVKEFSTTGAENTAYENNYKCVAIYNTGGNLIVLEQKFTIFNNNNKLNCFITSSLGESFQFGVGKPVLTCHVEDDSEIDSFHFIWSKEDINGTVVFDKKLTDELKTSNFSYYSELERDYQFIEYFNNDIFGPKIKYDAKGLHNVAQSTFKCVVQGQGEFGWVNRGVATITLKNDNLLDNSQYRIVIDNGSQVFQYNEIGISPADESMDEPITIKPLYAHFFAPNGEEVKEFGLRWIIPPEDNSLIKIPGLIQQYTDGANDEKYIVTDIEDPCSFGIQEFYNLNTLYNQIICCVTYKGQEFRKSTDFLFTKIGEVGTNGTDTTVKISENILDEKYNAHLALIKDNQTENEDNSNWEWNYIDGAVPYTANIYAKNEKVFGSSVLWRPAGMNSPDSKWMRIESSDNLLSVKMKDAATASKDDVRIATAKITLNNKTYHSSKPIYTIEYFRDNVFKNKKGIASAKEKPIDIVNPKTLQYITYDSNGTNPQMNTAQGGIFLNGYDWFKKNDHYIEWEAFGGVELEGQTNPAFSLTRVSGSTIGAKKLGRVPEVIDEIDLYIKQIDACAEAIKNDGLRNEIQTKNKTIKNFFKSTLIKNMQDRVSNSEEVLVSFGNLEATSEDRIYLNNIKEIWETMFNIIKEDIAEAINYNEKYKTLYENMCLIIESSKQEGLHSFEINSDVKLEHRNYCKKIWNFWEKTTSEKGLIVKLREELNKKNPTDSSTFYDDNTQTKKYLSFINSYVQVGKDFDNFYITSNGEKYKNTSLYSICGMKSQKMEEDTLTNWTPVASIYNNQKEFLNTFTSKIKTIVPAQKDISSSYGAVLIKYLTKEEIPGNFDYVYIIPEQTYNGIYCNNRVVATIKQKRDDVVVAKVTIPIHLSLNTYELASVNGWDGTHIEINEEGDYILAPQIGAGVKNPANNTFTGLVMGSISNKTQEGYSSEKVGLIGFSEGEQSIFLDAKTGAATFGLAKDGADANNPYSEGRIKLSPGGTSEISRWKIGRESLYNVVDGDVFKGQIKGYQNSVQVSDWDTPGSHYIDHEHSGILISAEPSFINVKSVPLVESDLDAKDVLKPGDSIAVELNPESRNVFSIYRYYYRGDNKTNPSRYAMAGINRQGRFFTNSLQDEGSAFGIGSISAFGEIANPDDNEKNSYIGARIGVGATNNETVDMAKFFIKNPDTKTPLSNYLRQTLYISGADISLDGNVKDEYKRPISIHGNTLSLYASTTPSSAMTTKNNILLNGSNLITIHARDNCSLDLNDGNTTLISDKSIIQKINNNNYLEINKNNSNYDDNLFEVKTQGKINLLSGKTFSVTNTKGGISITDNSGSNNSIIITKPNMATLTLGGGSNINTLSEGETNIIVGSKYWGETGVDGASLNIENRKGTISIKAWGKNQSSPAYLEMTGYNGQKQARFRLEATGAAAIQSNYDQNGRAWIEVEPDLVVNGYSGGKNALVKIGSDSSGKTARINIDGKSYGRQWIEAVEGHTHTFSGTGNVTFSANEVANAVTVSAWPTNISATAKVIGGWIDNSGDLGGMPHDFILTSNGSGYDYSDKNISFWVGKPTVENLSASASYSVTGSELSKDVSIGGTTSVPKYNNNNVSNYSSTN